MIVQTRGVGPLAGLRILELGHFVAAPFCARLLADWGRKSSRWSHPAAIPFVSGAGRFREPRPGGQCMDATSIA
jgi:CoA transferase family III